MGYDLMARLASRGKSRLLSFAWQAGLAVAVVVTVWLSLEFVSRRLGFSLAASSAGVLFIMSIWGMFMLWRR